MSDKVFYPYVTEALERIHGRLPKGGFSCCDPTNPGCDDDWYEQIVYHETETLVKPSKGDIIAEVEAIKAEEDAV